MTDEAAPGTGYIDIRTTLPYSGTLRLAYKKVVLVDNDKALATLGFLI